MGDQRHRDGLGALDNMKVNLRVAFNDGSAVDTAATTADQIAWEGEFSKAISDLATTMRLTDLCWLAWHSLTRQGSTGLDFGAWIETISEVTVTDEEAEPLPLERSPSTGG